MCPLKPRISNVAVKGRGAASFVESRFDATRIDLEDDGWGSLQDQERDVRPRTQITESRARSIISRNSSPDIGFSQSVNPYAGCEHGCSYCFARPSHAYLNLSPGLDFETQLFAKVNAAELLRKEIAHRSYRCSPIALGINTDAYQPIERTYTLARQCLEVLLAARHPLFILTKGALVTRDLDLLCQLAEHQLVAVGFSITTLDNGLAAKLEPRATAPHARLRAMRALSDAGIPTFVSVAPVIPMITDAELESILSAAQDAGAVSANYVLIRLPHEVSHVWNEWLELHYPERAAHVMSLIRQSRGGKDYEASWGERMRGTGVFAQMIESRFRVAWKRFGFSSPPVLRTDLFCPPSLDARQRELF